MVARRYEFYVCVRYLLLPREHKIHIFELTCNVLFIIYCKSTDDGVFDDFLKISDHFPKTSKNCSKLFRRPDEHS